MIRSLNRVVPSNATVVIDNTTRLAATKALGSRMGRDRSTHGTRQRSVAAVLPRQTRRA